jgi:DNA-binding response OmpR family regulator/gas vesicle protein
MHRILSVDDEPINQIIVEELFSDLYDVHLASSGEECLKTIDDIKPQLILLDVSMFGMDGYTTSILLKKRDSTKNIPVIFVSARSTLEDKIKGYEAGGHDYITKPFDHNELTIKINQLISNNIANTTLAHTPLANKGMAPSSAAHSITNLVKIEDFLNNAFNCNTLEELAYLLVSVCNNFNLTSVMQLRTDDTTLNISSSGQVTPLESSLFKDALAKNRFFDFGAHAIISYPHISLLIKNMPVEKPGRYEEFKHLLGVLIAGAESCLIAFNYSDILQKSYTQLFEIIKQNIHEFDIQDHKLKTQNISVLENLSRQIKNTCHELGLNTSQENMFQTITNDALEKTNKLFPEGTSQQERLEVINNSLKQILPVLKD